jgi:hypothetical protein
MNRPRAKRSAFWSGTAGIKGGSVLVSFARSWSAVAPSRRTEADPEGHRGNLRRGRGYTNADRAPVQ